MTTNPDGTLSATFKTIGAEVDNTYVFSPTSKSGVYHIGSHPDTLLAKLLGGERAAVLVVDENTAGVYDTVYADIDADYSFTNEKAARKGDEIIYQDLNGDGYADLSGGMIYWISDGANPLPVSDWLWGIGADVAGPGELVAFEIMDSTESGGNHGQYCASAVAAQGVINGNAPAWKPAGDGTPGTGMVQGGGKKVGLVGSGNFYVSVDDNEGILFAALGYDGYPNTADDVQIISNSWGNSGTDNDGWDYRSRAFDVALRYVNPTLSDMNSTGNGAPGYGTVTSPGEALSVGVAASTLVRSGYHVRQHQLDPADQLQRRPELVEPRPLGHGRERRHHRCQRGLGSGDLPLNEILNGWNDLGELGRHEPLGADRRRQHGADLRRIPAEERPLAHQRGGARHPDGRRRSCLQRRPHPGRGHAQCSALGQDRRRAGRRVCVAG